MKLQGLNPDFKHTVPINETTQYGDELMNACLITLDASCGKNKNHMMGEEVTIDHVFTY